VDKGGLFSKVRQFEMCPKINYTQRYKYLFALKFKHIMRLQIIDFLRGYSIFTIVVMHLLTGFWLPDIVQNALAFGGAGSHVFILVSGFGLCLSQLNKPLNYWEFFKRRFAKIYIPYILIVTISTLIPFVYTGDRLLALFSHAFLFKMFNNNFIESFGTQFWFISTIISFYLVFPALFKFIKNARGRGVILSFFISFIWATITGILEKSDLRIWNSFFLQCLGEFVLGMFMAIKYKENPKLIKIPSKCLLVVLAVAGMAMVGYMGIKGGVLKLYNDIPSLVGYICLALLIYSLGIKWINRFFIYTNKFSYEWYLVHILVFVCTFYLMGRSYFIAAIALLLSYGIAIVYNRLLKQILIHK
jgi:peptidoglycan/LPS O-acetylase OafA/YrhL